MPRDHLSDDSSKKLTRSFSRLISGVGAHQECDNCDFKNYDNPKPIAKAVVTWQDKILLVKRAGNDRAGYWDLPGGYHETGETSEEAAIRETMEEAGATIKIDVLLAQYELPKIGLIVNYFRGEMTSPDVTPCPHETQGAGLFPYNEIPWNDLAFQTVRSVLNYWHKVRNEKDFQPDRKTFRPFGGETKKPTL